MEPRAQIYGMVYMGVSYITCINLYKIEMTGIIIGRFQVPYLHPGHLHLIATALRECDKVKILLGCQRDIDERNPYNIGERIRMIRKIFPQVEIDTLWDQETDDTWSDIIDYILASESDPVLYHSRDSFKDHYNGRFPLREVEQIPGFSGTKLRKNEQGN